MLKNYKREQTLKQLRDNQGRILMKNNEIMNRTLRRIARGKANINERSITALLVVKGGTQKLKTGKTR